MKRYVVLILCIGFFSRAEAECSVAGMRVVDAVPAMIGIYSPDGKFETEKPKALLARNSSVMACDESLGLVKVALTDGSEVWVDRVDLKIAVDGKQEANTVCVKDSGSRAHDHTEPAVAGMDPKKPTDCVPTKP